VCVLSSAQGPPNPTQRGTQPVSIGETPIFRVEVVARTTKAINYRHRGGSTKIDFRGTPLLPEARGEAKVESKQGYIEVEVEFDDLSPATRFGPEYLTYVMWAITPEGRATNMGEVLLNGTKSKLNVTTELQAFGLIITAEPYFAVTQPSDVVVMENIVRRDTRGKIDEVEAKYELLKRGQYTMNVKPADLSPVIIDGKTPLELYEARNAVRMAQWAGADRYAAETYGKAVEMLRRAEDYHARNAGKKPTAMAARESVQMAEDSRLIAILRIEEARLAQERQDAAEREAQARAKAAEEAERRAQAESAKRAAEAERLAAERARREAESAAREASRQKAEADSARAAALAQQEALAAEAGRARQQAADAERMRQQAEEEKAKLRRDLLVQLNMILETRDSARGLIVNMSDVLFDFNKYTLRPGAREKLAKISGIVLAHSGLRLDVEGHTDSIGSDEYNQTLSENRANSVRTYLVAQGVKPDSVSSRGLGETTPVTDNSNAAGRQRNRRVELVVSGEVIGTRLDEVSRLQQ
jgi:outer membrane protein OmpA-like peptidoglycan-associated protein